MCNMDIVPLFKQIKENREFKHILTVKPLIKMTDFTIPRVPPGKIGPELTLRAHY